MKTIQYKIWDCKERRFIETTSIGPNFVNTGPHHEYSRLVNDEKDTEFLFVFATGLCDSTGRPLYDGDIVEFPSRWRGQVIFEKGGFTFREMNAAIPFYRTILDACRAKIVGSIFT